MANIMITIYSSCCYVDIFFNSEKIEFERIKNFQYGRNTDGKACKSLLYAKL
jgi:hypothetical protein